MAETSTLCVRQLAYDIDGKRILDDINLDLPAGRVSALLGPNGAGKTTLMRLLAGYPRPGPARCAWPANAWAAWTQRCARAASPGCRSTSPPGFR